MSRKICVVTGTRAEYGLLRWVMEGIRQAPSLKLQIIATGMHLSPEFGLTYQEIEHLDEAMRTKVGRMLDMRTQEGEIINKILTQVYDKVRDVSR